MKLLLLSIFLYVATSNALPAFQNNSKENIKDGYIEKRKSITGDSDSDKWAKAAREAVIRGILMMKDTVVPFASKAKIAMLGHPVGIATIMVITLIETSDNTQSPWQKFEEQIYDKIYRAISHYHHNDLETVWNMLTAKSMNLADQCTDFDIDDLVYILSHGATFFPQNYDETAGYDPKWIEANLQYLALVNSVYMDLIDNGRTDVCAWARELWIYKKAVIDAAKAFARGRWKDLEKHNWHGGYAGADAKVSYRDGVDKGKLYNEILLDEVEEKVFKDIAKDTEKYLFNMYINRFNALFGKVAPSGANLTCTIKVTKTEDEQGHGGRNSKAIPGRRFHFNLDDIVGVPDNGERLQLEAINAQTGDEGMIELHKDIDTSSGDGIGRFVDNIGGWNVNDIVIIKDGSYCKPAIKTICAIQVIRTESGTGGIKFFAKRDSISGINFLDKQKGFTLEGDDYLRDYETPDAVLIKVRNGRTKHEGTIRVTYNSDDAAPDEFVGNYIYEDTNEIMKKRLKAWKKDDWVIILDKKFCNPGCNPPTKIKEEELDLPKTYPKECYDMDGKCDLPCGSYNHNIKWCTRDKNIKTHGDAAKALRPYTPFGWIFDLIEKPKPDNFLEDCEEPNFSTCMKIDKLPRINWNERLAKIDKKKRRKPDYCNTLKKESKTE